MYPRNEHRISMYNDSTVGATLRAARESLGLTVRDMADITRIQPVWLECIEQDRYGEMPAEVFIRGFLRSYARELRLDEEMVFEAYLAQTDQLRQEEPVVVEEEMDTVERFLLARYPMNSSSGRYLYGAAVAAFVAVLAGVVLALSSGVEPDAAATNFRVNDTTEAWQPALDNSSDWRRR